MPSTSKTRKKTSPKKQTGSLARERSDSQPEGRSDSPAAGSLEVDERSADDAFLSLDIGGTNVTCGLVTRRGDVLATDIFPVAEAGETSAEIIQLVNKRLYALWRDSKIGRPPLAVAIGAPGWIKPKEGIVVNAPNLKGWVNIPITKIVSEALSLPVRLENDSNLYALGEWLAGAGQGCDNQIVVTLGTGVGAGLILNGKLWNGSFTSAAEIGHIPLGPSNTVTCGCGRVGCLETMASARGIARMARKWLEAGKETIFKGTGEELNAQIMNELAERGDPMSLHVFKQAGLALGQILAGVFNLLSLERAVLGGGASGAFKFIKAALVEYLEPRLVTASIDQIQIVKSSLGIHAPLVGGAGLLTAEGF
ncbi:MAG: ROK family protein [Deltaproteobacteria bacterium]|jgi:glucokinase|nr:ROK family protein [Deltaproteobacteria bacterium]